MPFIKNYMTLYILHYRILMQSYLVIWNIAFHFIVEGSQKASKRFYNTPPLLDVYYIRISLVKILLEKTLMEKKS